MERNKKLEDVSGPPNDNSSIQLPFIIVNTSKKTVIDCSISNDKLVVTCMKDSVPTTESIEFFFGSKFLLKPRQLFLNLSKLLYFV